MMKMLLIFLMMSLVMVDHKIFCTNCGGVETNSVTKGCCPPWGGTLIYDTETQVCVRDLYNPTKYKVESFIQQCGNNQYDIRQKICIKFHTGEFVVIPRFGTCPPESQYKYDLREFRCTYNHMTGSYDLSRRE